MANELKVVITGDAGDAMVVLDRFREKAVSTSKEATSAADQMTAGFSRAALGFGSMAVIGAMAGAKLLEGVKGAISAIPEAVAHTNELARTFEGLSFQTGESLERLNIFDATMKLTGGSIEQLGDWLTGVTRSMKSNSEVFIANGIAASQAALMQMKPVDVMKASLAVIESCTDQNKKLILTQELLGRGAINEIPQMRRFFETLADGKDALEKYGKGIDQNAIARMIAMQRQAGDVSIAMDKVKKDIAEQTSGLDLAFGRVNLGFAQMFDGIIRGWNQLENPIDALMQVPGYLANIMKEEDASVYALQHGKEDPAGEMQREQMRGAHTGPQPQTKEEIDAAKEAKRKAAEDQKKAATAAREAARKAEEEAKKGIETRLNLMEQANHLGAEDLKTMDATTIEQRKQRGEAEALAQMKENYRKIYAEIEKKDTPEGQEAAAAARLAAHKLYLDQLAALNRTAKAEHLAEDAATKAAEAEANKKAFEELKKSLAQQSEIQGKMSRGQIEERLKAETAKGGASAHAALQYMVEVHWDGTAAGGAEAGMRDFIAKGDGMFNEFRSTTLQAMNGIQDGMAHSIESIVEGTAKGGQAVKAFGKSIETSAVGALAKMASQYLMTAAAGAAFGSALSTANAAQMGSAEALATAEIWASWAPLSLVGGEAAALAEIAVMTGSIAAASGASKVASGTGGAFAVGGLIDTPTLALMGEAGPELVAPVHDFNDWANAHQNLGYNLAAHNAQVGRLNTAAGSYATQGLKQNGGATPPSTVTHIYSPIYADSTEGQRRVDKMVNASTQRIGRAQS